MSQNSNILIAERLTEAEPGSKRAVAAGLSLQQAAELHAECDRAIRAFGLVGTLAVSLEGPAPGRWTSEAYSVTVVRVGEN